jgi:hypothetical protein
MIYSENRFPLFGIMPLHEQEPWAASSRSAFAPMAATLGDADGNLVRRTGIMSIVVSEGDVWPGDAIEIELPTGPQQKLLPV